MFWKVVWVLLCLTWQKIWIYSECSALFKYSKLIALYEMNGFLLKDVLPSQFLKNTTKKTLK